MQVWRLRIGCNLFVWLAPFGKMTICKLASRLAWLLCIHWDIGTMACAMCVHCIQWGVGTMWFAMCCVHCKQWGICIGTMISALRMELVYYICLLYILMIGWYVHCIGWDTMPAVKDLAALDGIDQIYTLYTQTTTDYTLYTQSTTTFVQIASCYIFRGTALVIYWYIGEAKSTYVIDQWAYGYIEE